MTGEIEKLISLFKKYRSVILYLFFGGVTTLVNIVCYYLAYHQAGLPNEASTAVAWAVSVLVAYLTNRKWVFDSKASGLREISAEIVSFFSCRFATGLLDMAIMGVAVDILHRPDMLWKILSNVLVIVLNYIVSKFLVFREKHSK